MLSLDLVLRKMDTLNGFPAIARIKGKRDGVWRKSHFVSDAKYVYALKEYEAVTGAKITPDKSVVLQLSIWSGRPMKSNGVLGHWIHG